MAVEIDSIWQCFDDQLFFSLSFVAIISGLLDKNVLLCGILQLPQPEFL